MKSQGNKYDGQLRFVDKQTVKEATVAQSRVPQLDILMVWIEMIAACVFAAKIGTMIICSPSLVAVWGHSRQQGMQPERSLKPFALQWTAGKAKTRREWCHAVLSCVSGDTRRHKHVHDGKVRPADASITNFLYLYIDMCSFESQN